ncbi:MAG TPA: cupin domain-containing protein [Steroidobacteraceae bacterium]|nr:cupin domain-containing protein [Steroidobacteraceae bacterium]
MLFADAQRTLQEFLSPLTLDEFLDRTLSGGLQRVAGTGSAARRALLGPDPRQLLGAALQLAPKLTFHSANPLGPAPALTGVRDADDFRERIALFHARNYSVRFPELRPLSPQLDRLARAFEVILLQPVTASAFWSMGGMRAPVHYDDHDLIVVQLLGAKHWYVANTSELPVPWRGIPPERTELGPHTTFDVSPGDLVYLPRGTLHSVESAAESLHLSIGFTPLTVREGLIAAVDQLSEVDRALRETIGGRLAWQLGGAGSERLAGPVLEGLERLRAACRMPGFLAAALQRRSSRIVATLAPLPAGTAPVTLDLDCELVQSETAFCQLTGNSEKIDFSYPGGHIYIHRAAEPALLFMVNTPRFRPRDVPGEMGDEVRLSLASRLVEIGFLKLASSTPPG